MAFGTPDAAAPAERHRRAPALAIALLLALALRVWGIQTQSFTMDEMTELDVVQRGLGGVIGFADGFPPLYGMALHWWLELTGTPEAARWLSVLFGLLAIPAIQRLGRVLRGRAVGDLSATLLAISPFHIWYSQEVRAYALFFLLAVVTIWRYEVARRTDRPRDWLWYGVAVVAGWYTHYYFAFVLLGLAVADAVAPDGPRRWRRWIQVHAGVGVLVLPLWSLLQSDLQAQAEWIATNRALDLPALAYTFFTYLAGFSLGPSLRELHTIRPLDAVREVLPWAVPVGLATAYLLIRGWSEPTQRPAWYRLATQIATTLVACGVASAAMELGYRIRYVVWCAGPLLILLALGAAGARRRWAALAAFGVLTFVSAVAIANRHAVGRYMNEDARGAARLVERLSDASSPFFVISGYMANPVEYYLDASRTLTPLWYGHTNVSPGTGLGTIRRTTGSGKTFWLLYSRPFDGDPHGRILDDLERHAQLRLVAEVPGFQMYRGVGW
jgi:mannosyltransferase